MQMHTQDSRQHKLTDCTAVDIFSPTWVKSLRHSDISIWNTSGLSRILSNFEPGNLLLPLRAVCCKSICGFKQKREIRPEGHKHHRNRSKLGNEWKKNQLCQNPLLTISAGEGAFSCLCCGWLFWEWHPRQLGLFVWLLSSELIVTARWGILTNALFTGDKHKLTGHRVETLQAMLTYKNKDFLGF